MTPVTTALVLLLVTAAGSALPLLSRRTDRALHLLIAFATGVFLGAVFLHLVPELAEQATRADDRGVWFWMLAGVVGLFLLENLGFERGHPGHDDHRHHRAVGYASLFGLSVHAFTTGLALGAAEVLPELELPLFLSAASHKTAEGFSLTTVFLLAGYGVRRIAWLSLAFALIAPLGLAFGVWLVPGLDAAGVRVFTALAAGTFLFVALCDLLPEVFHRHEDAPAKVALLALGVGAVFVPRLLGA